MEGKEEAAQPSEDNIATEEGRGHLREVAASHWLAGKASVMCRASRKRTVG